MSRSTRRTEFELSTLDRLLIAQAVYELGGNAWPSVAKLLSKHPLLSHPRSFFTAQSCHAMYKQLRKEAELDITEADNTIHAPLNLKLAQIHYQARHAELRSLIAETEENFKKTAAEIENIRNGRQEQHQTPAAPEPEPELTVDAEMTHAEDKAESDLSSLPSQEKVDQAQESTVQELATEVETTPLPSEDASTIEQPEEETVPQQQPVSSPPSMPDAPSPQDIDINELFEPEPEDEEEQPKQSQPTSTLEPLNEQPGEPEADVEAEEEISVTAPQSPAVESELEAGAEVPALSSLPQTSHPSPEPEAPIQRETVTSKPPSEPETMAEATPMDVDEPQAQQQPESGSEEKVESEVMPQPSERAPEKSEQPEGEDEGATSSDEPPQKPRANRRGRPPNPNRNVKSKRRKSVPVSERGTEEPEEDIKREATEEATASPVPEKLKTSGKRRRSFADGHETPKKRPRDDSEPVDEDEAGPSSTTRGRRRNEGNASKKFQNVIGMLHSQISQHRNGTIFHNPIRDSEAPDYHDIVKRPMDLKTIKTKIRDGAITNSLEFQRDIYLMFANAMMYNRPGSDVYIMAEDMMSDSEVYINTFRQTEGFVIGGGSRR
ncbi:hypothetical protein VKT23_002027 [Stygiomarasmius scandens]|uniref:Bromo domain-containing protein n=1 Tax=Marasmiellus scandens TaxID=2682957 RepID=A0ABR1K165_9AGAR